MTENVFLFIPNLIGYSRVVLAAVSFYLLPSDPVWAISLYLLSCILDAFDGHAARYFNQSTKFGAVLDMVTDRSTTTCLLVHLAIQFPKYALFFQLLISLDLSSHYMHMYSQIHSGLASHKTISDSQNKLLKLYYTNSTVLFLVCAGDQIFFIFLYLFYFPRFQGNLLYALGVASFPVCLFKQIVNVIQMINASLSLAEADVKGRGKMKSK